VRRRVVLVVAVGAGVALGPVQVLASPAASTSAAAPASARSEQDAIALLEAAALAGRSLTYTGTQYVATWSGRDSDSALAEVAHDAEGGSVVTTPASAAAPPVPMTATVDRRLLGLLAASYELVVAAPGRCAGRTTDVVEAYRPEGTLAGRFWLDKDSGLLLRREVFDEAGRRIRSSAFLDLQVTGAGSPTPAPPGPAGKVSPSPEQLRADGWQVPPDLPAGFELFDARLSVPVPGEQVLHLAYSDGLSTLSLFAQGGRLGTEPPAGFTAEQVDSRPVWVRSGAPERVVWSGGGRVWTLVSDASPQTVRAAVEALPRDPAPQQGLVPRLGRGASRMLEMLNPFG